MRTPWSSWKQRKRKGKTGQIKKARKRERQKEKERWMEKEGAEWETVKPTGHKPLKNSTGEKRRLQHSLRETNTVSERAKHSIWDTFIFTVQH